VATPQIETDPAVVASFLSDAAHVPGGFAAGVAFPATVDDVVALVSSARHILPIGAQSSLTGGATPRGEVVLSTRALTSVGWLSHDRVSVGAGVSLAELQRTLAARRLYYPPVPTFDGAFVGGTIATNAAGAATFKYGSTRQWVEAVTVVLANGDLLEIRRGACVARRDGHFEIPWPSGGVRLLQAPAYEMPDVAKLSAGYYSKPGMDLIDLFIGSEGTLGIVVRATLKVIPLRQRCVSMIRCRDDSQAIGVTAALRSEAHRTWAGRGTLDVSAVEYMDCQALEAVPDEAFARSGMERPRAPSALLLVQIELGDNAEGSFEDRLLDLLNANGVADDPLIAAPGDDRGARALFDLREAVPAGVNALVAAAKAREHSDIEKTAGDMIVPFDRLEKSIALYRRAFERRRLRYAIWGHVSDGNLHPNVIPGSLNDVERGREALMEIAGEVVRMGGAPLAEHGVGRSPLKQRLLCELYGREGIEQMRAIKRALDPEWKLSPGVLFTAED
jgi:D-lactate dehydrogenase (cytochrome)